MGFRPLTILNALVKLGLFFRKGGKIATSCVCICNVALIDVKAVRFWIRKT